MQTAAVPGVQLALKAVEVGARLRQAPVRERAAACYGADAPGSTCARHKPLYTLKMFFPLFIIFSKNLELKIFTGLLPLQGRRAPGCCR